MNLAFDHAIATEGAQEAVSEEVIKRCRARAKAMLAKLSPKQRALVLDGSPHVSALCPRRAGKTYAAAMAALITGEAKPGAISLIISLNKQQLRRLYWAGGASGLHKLAHAFGVKLHYNENQLRWEHENGSIGYLLGCEDDEQLEVIRGLEADLYVVDECKSFVLTKLARLIDDIIDPQRSSRRGKLLLIGTPGFTPKGPFYEATCQLARDKSGKPYMLPFGETDPWGRTPEEDLLWSFHSWTLQENTAKAHQWTDALKKKRQKGWADDHPTWCREYLGQWTSAGDGFIFRYPGLKSTGRVTWIPQPTKENPAGLPREGAPWRFIAGLDIGYEAPTVLVVCAYSRRLKQLRHVVDVSRRHLLVHEIADLIHEAQARFGPIEKIFADKGNLGKTIVHTLVNDHGFALEAADKREKFDYFELLNAGFEAGEVLVTEHVYDWQTGKDIPSAVDEQLIIAAYDLGDDEKEDLARAGKLKEDPAIPNDATDAFVYCYRGSLHHFGVFEAADAPDPHSPEGIEIWEKRELERARASFKESDTQGLEFNKRAPGFVRRALARREWIPSRPSPQTSFRRS